MDSMQREPNTRLTVDVLLQRLETLERAFATLQQAYTDLQARGANQGRAHQAMTAETDEVLSYAPAGGMAKEQATVSGRDTVGPAS